MLQLAPLNLQLPWDDPIGSPCKTRECIPHFPRTSVASTPSMFSCKTHSRRRHTGRTHQEHRDGQNEPGIMNHRSERHDECSSGLLARPNHCESERCSSEGEENQIEHVKQGREERSCKAESGLAIHARTHSSICKALRKFRWSTWTHLRAQFSHAHTGPISVGFARTVVITLNLTWKVGNVQSLLSDSIHFRLTSQVYGIVAHHAYILQARIEIWNGIPRLLVISA